MILNTFFNQRGIERSVLFGGISLLCLFILICSVFDLLKLDSYSENRRLKQWPQLALQTTKKRDQFFRDLEVASSEQFPLRTLAYVSLTTLRFYIFGMPNDEVRQTVDGYLWSSSSLKVLTEDKQIEESAVQVWQTYIAEQLKKYKTKNINFSCLIIPAKEHSMIWEKRLPDPTVKIKGEFYRQIGSHFPGVFFNGPHFFEEYLKTHSQFKVFYKTDIHWRLNSANLFAENFLKIHYNETVPENFYIEVPDILHNNMYSRLGIYSPEPVLLQMTSYGSQYSTMIDSSVNELIYNHESVVKHVFTRSSSTEKLLLYGDSMAQGLIQVLGAHYREIYYVHPHQLNEPQGQFPRDWPAMAERLKVNQVVGAFVDTTFPPIFDAPPMTSLF